MRTTRERIERLRAWADATSPGAECEIDRELVVALLARIDAAGRRELEIMSCQWCERATVEPVGDKCRHCGEELYPVALLVPFGEIVRVVVRPGFATLDHEGIVSE